MTEPVVPTAPPSASGPAISGRVPGWAAWTLRLIVTLHAVLIFLQPVLAGLFVTGNVGMLGLHSANAIFITMIAFFQIIASILFWRPGRGAAWPIWASVLMFLVGQIQGGFGYARLLALHFPLGVLLFGFAVAMLVWAWSPGMRVAKSKSRRQSGEV